MGQHVDKFVEGEIIGNADSMYIGNHKCEHFLHQ